MLGACAPLWSKRWSLKAQDEGQWRWLWGPDASPHSQPPAGAIPPAQGIEIAMKVGKGFTGFLWSQKGPSWGQLHGHVNGRPT